MTDILKRPKTNDHCPHFVKGICMLQKRRCNNKSMFYEECNLFMGNRSLKAFI